MFHTVEEAIATFDYHKPSDDQVDRITVVRVAHKALVRAIWNIVPSGPDRTVAVRKIHESMMTCNKAIVCEGSVTG
jgi:Xaa-Pro aminopeptidase